MTDLSAFTIQQLRETLSKLDLALGSINESIVWINEQGIIEWCNRAFFEITQTIRIKTLSKKINDVLFICIDNQSLDTFNTIKDVSTKKADRGKHFQLLVQGKYQNIELFSRQMKTSNKQVYYIILIRDVTEREYLLQELQRKNERQLEYQRKLAVAERRAGMADIASSVLHNIGNVLNSVNVTTTLIDENITRSKLDHLPDLYELIKSHEENIDVFFTEDPKGKRVIEYLGKIAAEYNENKIWMKDQVHSLQNHIEHIKQIVQDQNNLAKLGGVAEEVFVPDLINEVVTMHENKFIEHNILLETKYDDTKKAYIDQVKVMQILINLIKNSVESVIEATTSKKIITVSLKDNQDKFSISVQDNGVGIDCDNKKKLFTVQFTTKKQGHGFGLHASAIAAEQLGGKIYVVSPGINKGATFTLELPYKKGR